MLLAMVANLILGVAKVFSLKSFLKKSFSAISFKGLGEYFASLGAWGGKVEEVKKKRKKIVDVVEEAIPQVVISRLRDEMLAASLTEEIIARAKARAKQKRNNTVALLMMI